MGPKPISSNNSIRIGIAGSQLLEVVEITVRNVPTVFDRLVVANPSLTFPLFQETFFQTLLLTSRFCHSLLRHEFLCSQRFLVLASNGKGSELLGGTWTYTMRLGDVRPAVTFLSKAQGHIPSCQFHFMDSE